MLLRMKESGIATRIALLRAVNVAGHSTVSMADLRAFLAGLGFGQPRSLLQSGNLIFDGGERTSAELENLLEAEAAKRLELRTDFFVRGVDDWASIVAGNPFPEEAERDPGHLVVLFLKEAVDATAVEALQSAVVGSEVIRAGGRQLYVTYPDGIGRSKLTNTLMERKLGRRATGRNWNTVLKLNDLTSSMHA